MPQPANSSSAPLSQEITILMTEEKESKATPSEIQSLPREPIFPYNQFTPLLDLWVSSFDRQTPEFSYYVVTKFIPLILAALGASGYYPTGRALFNYFKETDVFSEATPSFWEHLWTVCITIANFLQIQKFAGVELIQLYPNLSQGWNEPLYQLYGQQKEGRCKQALKIALQVTTALGLQTSIGLMVQAATGSWRDFGQVVLGEFVLMLSAVLLLLDTGKDAWHWIMKSLFGTIDDMTALQIKYHGYMTLTPDLPAQVVQVVRVAPSELSALRQQLIVTTLQNFTDRLQKVLRNEYQAYLTSSDQTNEYGSIQSNHITFESILQIIEKSKAENTLESDLIPDLFKPLLAQSTSPTFLVSLKKNIKLSLQFTPHPEGSLRWSSNHQSGFNPLKAFAFAVTTLPMAVVFPLNVLNFQLDPQSPELPFVVSATFGLSAVAISYLITHINRNRLNAIFKELDTIQQKGISHWYATTLRPATWPQNTWKQIPYLLTLSALTVIASQAYASVLKGIVSSISSLLNIEGESQQLLAKIFWPIMSLSNLTFNLHFMSSALKSAENLINWSTRKWASLRQKSIIAFDAEFTRLLAHLVMPFKHSTQFFPEQPSKIHLSIQTFLLLVDELILSTPENEREEMTQKCFSMSLDDLKRVIVTTIQELHSNLELEALKDSLNDSGSLAKLKPLLEEFGVTLPLKNKPKDNRNVHKTKESLPFELTDDNIDDFKKVRARKPWSWCSLYSKDNSSEEALEEPILVDIEAEAESPEEQAETSRTSSSLWNCFGRHSRRTNENERLIPEATNEQSCPCLIM